MKITKTAQAGTQDASDILITVMPNDQGGIQVKLEAKRVILKQFGKQMEQVIRDKVEEMGVEDITVKAQDKGALDYTIRARVQSALERALV